MSFFNSFLRALGFESDSSDELDYDNDTSENVVEPVAESDTVPETETPTEAPAVTPDQESDIDAIAADMMASVVQLFNSFQPEFIARCLDTERQQKLIAEHLTPALRGRLAAIAQAERERIVRESADERANINADLKRMRERNTELEERREAFKNEQLSATRQKRAMQGRIHDLETKNEELAAEKEQLELENRSMANKLRVVGVGGQIPASDSESETTPTASAQPEKQEPDSELREKLEQLTAANEELTARLTKAEEQHKADTVELEDMREQVAQIQIIAEQAEKVADLVEKKDARIAELKSRVKSAEEAYRTIERLEKENKSLRNTIESNLYEHASQMAGLRQELEETRSKAPRRGRPRKERPEEISHPDHDDNVATPKTPRITAIDELLEGSEWLVAPTPDEVRVPVAEDPSDDFGYKAPPRKPVPNDDANQLTLF
ncbi:MAG: hypothetical protein HDR92_09280 [Bacteroides sp.]|nr:hypothetical protein [Bacteroides sp.]